MLKTSGLTVRQHERAGIAAPVEFTLCQEHRQQVRFSPQSTAADHHIIHAMSADISPGGMGLHSRYYLPRTAEGVVRIVDGSLVLLEQRAKVRRVFLTGREPRYLIGLAFLAPPDDIEDRIAAIVARFEDRRAADDATGDASPEVRRA